MKILVEVNTEKENEYVYSKIQYNERHVWRNCKRFLNIDDGSYYQSKSCAENNGYKIISFEEFKSGYEPQLKIGDTFEYKGFVCEVKENIEENIWFLLRNKYTKSITYRCAKKSEFYYFNNDEDVECTEITNKEFIKQLEENAR